MLTIQYRQVLVRLDSKLDTCMIYSQLIAIFGAWLNAGGGMGLGGILVDGHHYLGTIFDTGVST